MGANDVCVVVPVFNEAVVLRDVLEQLRMHFPNVVCVDDGSSDGSASIAEAAGATVLRHPLNLGQGAALQTGFDFAMSHESHYRYIVTFDSDGQHDPSDAVRMVQEARQSGVAVVLGSRVLGSAVDQPRGRRALLIAARLFTRLTTRLEFTDPHNGLRVLSRYAVSSIRLKQHGMAHASELLERIASKRLTWAEFPVTLSYSAYSTAKGQRNIAAVNVLFDLAISRLRVAP